MAANINAIYPKIPNVGVAVISAANTNRTVTGITGLTLLFTAGGNGSRVDSISMVATGTTTAGVIRIWYYTGTGNATLVMPETMVLAIVPSASLASWASEQLPINMVLPAGSFLYASTHNAEAFAITARGGDY